MGTGELKQRLAACVCPLTARPRAAASVHTEGTPPFTPPFTPPSTPNAPAAENLCGPNDPALPYCQPSVWRYNYTTNSYNLTGLANVCYKGGKLTGSASDECKWVLTVVGVNSFRIHILHSTLYIVHLFTRVYIIHIIFIQAPATSASGCEQAHDWSFGVVCVHACV